MLIKDLPLGFQEDLRTLFNQKKKGDFIECWGDYTIEDAQDKWRENGDKWRDEDLQIWALDIEACLEGIKDKLNSAL